MSGLKHLITTITNQKEEEENKGSIGAAPVALGHP